MPAAGAVVPGLAFGHHRGDHERAERDEHAEPVSNSEIEVTVEPGFKKEDVRAQITSILEQVPGITTNVGQPIEHRLSHILSGTPAAIAISARTPATENAR